LKLAESQSEMKKTFYSRPLGRRSMNVKTNSEVAGHQSTLENHAVLCVISHMNPSILLIDDDQPFRRALRLHLENRGKACQEADDGLEALALLDGGLKVDLVISDYHMPIINGLDFLKALSYRVNGWNIPVILMSGHWTAEMEYEAKQAGAFDLLAKPYDLQDLLTLVSRACP
jgi:DNA-binding NtrC family response regulator